MKFKFLVFVASILTFFSCKKTETEKPTTDGFSAPSSGLYIANEGQFMNGNGSITFYNGTLSSTVQDVFATVNGVALGDVCQSMKKIADKIYIVVNNSAKIEVVTASTMKRVATISGLMSPRYIFPISLSKAYVSDLYANKLSVINLNLNTVTNTIDLNGSTEEMILYNGKVYVTNLNTPYLYVINPTTDQLEDSILIGIGGNSIQIDSNNKLWVLCGGDYVTSTPASLHKVDPATGTAELSLIFPAFDYPTRLKINETGDELYFLDVNVYKMAIIDNNLPSTIFIDANGRSLYGLAYDKRGHFVYVTDAIDYQQDGRAYKYDLSGNEISNFPTGIIPGDILFLNN